MERRCDVSTHVQRGPDQPESGHRRGGIDLGLGVVVLKPLFRPLLLGAVSSKLVGLTLWFTGQHHAALVFFFAPDPFVLHAVLAPSSQGLVRVFTRFASDRQAVWLTIDDGPDEHDTPDILDVLDRYSARATFFVIGARAARWPHLVQEITRRGHQIGHHTHTHPAGTFWYANSRRLGVELDRTLDILGKLGVRPQLFRAPVGIKPLF